MSKPRPIAIVVEFPRPLPRAGDLYWASAVARCVERRGHEALILCDAEGDAGRLASTGLRVEARRARRAWRDRSPIAFPRWARRRADQIGSLVVSLHALVPGDVWAPAHEPASSELAWALKRPGLASRMFETLQRPGVALAAAMEPRIAHKGWHARRTMTRFGLPADGADVLPAAGRFGAPGMEEVAALRARTRRALAIDEDALVVAPIAQSHDSGAMSAALTGAARLPGSIVLLAGRASRTLEGRAVEAGLGGRTRHAGGTARADAVFAAADVVVKAGERPAARLLSEAISMGRAIAIDGRDPDARAVLDPGIGAIALASRADLWEDAIGTAAALDVRAACAEAAQSLTLDALGEALLERLREI